MKWRKNTIRRQQNQALRTAFTAEDTMAELEGYLASLKKDQLRAYAKELGLRGYSGLRKEGLADLIAGLLLDPSVMRRRMGILTDEQIRIFEKACGHRNT